MKTREAWGLARRPEEPLAAPTTGAPPISSPGPRQGQDPPLAGGASELALGATTCTQSRGLAETRGTKSHRYWTQGVGGVEAKRES